MPYNLYHCQKLINESVKIYSNRNWTQILSFYIGRSQIYHSCLVLDCAFLQYICNKSAHQNGLCGAPMSGIDSRSVRVYSTISTHPVPTQSQVGISKFPGQDSNARLRGDTPAPKLLCYKACLSYVSCYLNCHTLISDIYKHRNGKFCVELHS